MNLFGFGVSAKIERSTGCTSRFWHSEPLDLGRRDNLLSRSGGGSSAGGRGPRVPSGQQVVPATLDLPKSRGIPGAPVPFASHSLGRPSLVKFIPPPARPRPTELAALEGESKTPSPGGGTADAGDSKSPARKGVWVQIPPRVFLDPAPSSDPFSGPASVRSLSCSENPGGASATRPHLRSSGSGRAGGSRDNKLSRLPASGGSGHHAVPASL